MARPCMIAGVKAWINQLASLLDERVAWRLLPLLTGLLFATGRRTVSSWLRAGQLSMDYQDYYYFLCSLGRKVELLAGGLLRIVAGVVASGERIVLAIDDTPSKRYGPKVEGAGVHHNPTPGPAGAKFVYGHNWVTLAWVVRHRLWGAIGLPLLARMYVRQKDIVAQQLTCLRGIRFQTKLVMAGELLTWAATRLEFLGRKIWLVADGAYAKKVFLKAAAKAQVIVVSRLRKDAALWDVPKAVPPGQRGRGRPRKYGTKRISLAKRRPAQGLAGGNVCALRCRAGEALQNLLGDVQASGRFDPGGVSDRRGRYVAGLLLHPCPGQCDRDPGSGGRPLGRGTGIP